MTEEIWKEKWELANDCIVYVDSRTLKNMDIIYEFFAKKKTEAKGKRNPKYSYFKIATQTGVNRKQVVWACFLLAMKRDKPYLKIVAERYISNGSGKIYHNVELLRFKGEN